MLEFHKKYEQLLKRLFNVNLHSGMKLGLKNMQTLNDLIGNPIKSLKCIHVAGTNGKGSVSTKIAKGLEEEGFQVGLFTSPHISTFRERIKVNGILIDENTTILILEQLFAIIEKEKIPATFFEITTCLAFLYFVEKNVDYAVLETGLGGRLDATNIVTPLLSIITSISIEHTEFLGTTLDDITKEKAGIIKPKIPIIIGPTVSLRPIQDITLKMDSPLIVISEIQPTFNDENNALARKALELMQISKDSIEKGLKAMPTCRMETVKENPHIILDVAHNPEGLKALFKTLKMLYPDGSFRLVFGLSKTKDVSTCLTTIKDFACDFHLVESLNDRNIEVNTLKKMMLELDFDPKSIFVESTISKTIFSAIEKASEQKQIIIVCGSFFIMGDVRAALNLNEPCDEFDMNERK